MQNISLAIPVARAGQTEERELPGEVSGSIPGEGTLELRFQLVFALRTNVEEFHEEPKEGC